jgi:adenosylhomocysteine nucleosidase
MKDTKVRSLLSKKFMAFACILSVSISYAKSMHPEPALYAIISPMPSEAQYIRSKMMNKKEIIKLDIHYLSGTIDGRHVISVISGYGKVNVTTVASRLFASFHPDAVILAETAGSINKQLKIGDVVIGTQLFDADFGEMTEKGPSLPILIDNPINNKKEPLIFEADPFLMKMAIKTAKEIQSKQGVVFSVIANSDFLPNPDWQLNLMRKNGAQAVSMDGVPVTKLAWIFSTPSLVFHAIANVAGEPIENSNTEMASKNMGELVVKFIGNLPKTV